jgi:hypothetical protein
MARIGRDDRAECGGLRVEELMVASPEAIAPGMLAEWRKTPAHDRGSAMEESISSLDGRKAALYEWRESFL